MNIKLYQCFHDRGSFPKEKYLSELRPALLCGTDIEWRDNKDIQNCLKDNIGNNISIENTQYSELTGYYWIWKNQPTVDIIGIEHYRRHFIKHNINIDNYVKPEDLITENDIITLLDKYQFILPVPEGLWNTSVYDLYVICFNEQAKDIMKYMKKYYIETKQDNYLNAVYTYMANNTLYRANMLITTQKEFNHYCEEMFKLLDYIKQNMEVKPDSRIWGYISELFPAIYIIANNKTFTEVDIAVDDFNLDLQKEIVVTTINNCEGEHKNNSLKQIEFFKSL